MSKEWVYEFCDPYDRYDLAASDLNSALDYDLDTEKDDLDELQAICSDYQNYLKKLFTDYHTVSQSRNTPSLFKKTTRLLIQYPIRLKELLSSLKEYEKITQSIRGDLTLALNALTTSVHAIFETFERRTEEMNVIGDALSETVIFKSEVTREIVKADQIISRLQGLINGANELVSLVENKLFSFDDNITLELEARNSGKTTNDLEGAPELKKNIEQVKRIGNGADTDSYDTLSMNRRSPH